MGDPNEISPRSVTLRLAVALLVAIGLRLYLASIMPAVSRDGVTFIWYAQRLAANPLEEARREKQHPLYPALIAATHGVLDRVGIARTDSVRQWVIAGQSVAVAASLVLIPAIYLLTATLFNRRIGIVAAACTAVLPEFARYGVDVLSDTLHLSLYVLALTAGMTGLLRRSWGRLALAGLLSGLAFLVRPEGGEVALVVFVFTLLAGGWSWRRRLAGVTACVLGFILVAGPYMVVTGRVVQKKSLRRFIGAQAVARPAQAPPPLLASTSPRTGMLGFATVDAGGMGRGLQSWAFAIGKPLHNWVRSLRVMYLLPAVAWLLLRGRRPNPAGVWRVPVGAWLLHVAVCVLLIYRYDYGDLFSVRHVLVLTALTLPWTAAGLTAIVDLMTAVPRSWLTPARAWALMALILVAPTLPWLLRTPNAEYAYLRQAGQWIHAHYPQPQCIMTDQWHVPFYARARFCERYANGWTIHWPGTADAAELVAWVQRERPTLVVLERHHLQRENAAFFDDLNRLALTPGLLRQVHTVSSDDPKHSKAALIYEVRP